MLARRSSTPLFHRLGFICLVSIFLILSGCQGTGTPTAGSPPAEPVVPTASPRAEVTFIAHLPAKLAPDQNLYLDLMDEVTGLALNPIRAKMETQDHQNFGVRIPFPNGSVIKYRYVRDNDPVGVEYNSLNQQVRYRLYLVDGPGLVHDTVTGWKAAPISSGLGRIRGQVANKSTNGPVVNALVSAGGIQTLTASDGSFLLEGLPPGTHNLVVYSLDGSYRPFQQGAVVGSDSTTPALVIVNPSKLVNVTFVVHPPADNIKDVPIRLVGNLLSLGNTFADLSGGVNTMASRAPLLTASADGAYTIKMKLPAGTDLRYKYSLGDGFWNAEHSANGEMRVRQVIIPDQDIMLEDTIDTWNTSGFAPVTFNVTVPADTPAADTISIQFNPYGWTEPVPMWSKGDHHWTYVLYSPLDAFATVSYRYCRNDQCGLADAAETRGPGAAGKAFTPQTDDQTFTDTVTAWAWLDPLPGPVTVPGLEIKPQGADFKAGVELSTGYRPSWQPHLAQTFQNVKDIAANTVMLTPTWHVTRLTPPVVEAVPGQDPLWYDLTQMISQAQKKGLEVSLHPVLVYPEDPAAWWQKAPHDDGWWQTWFAEYRTFMLYHADLAAQTGAKSLVIGDASLLPALPGAVQGDGGSTGVPGDAAKLWSQLITDIRTRYKGKLLWLVPYSGSLPPLPEAIKSVDMVYVQVSAPFVQTDQPSAADLEAGFTQLLDGTILKIQEQTKLPIIIGLQYPSVTGAANGCQGLEGGCPPGSTLNRPQLAAPAGDPSLQVQADLYSAALTVINQRSWIKGFFSIGYNPVVDLRDTSISVRSKPAGNLLWYWYSRLIGNP